MTQDHYAILGVAPTAEPVAIRAAYLALMREYHPDRNSSPAAVERAQAIIAAFKVLGDFDQRSYYDWDQRRERERAAAELAAAPRRKAGAGLVAAVAVGLAAAGALMFRPNSAPAPTPIDPPAAKRVEQVAQAAPTKQRKRVTVIALDKAAKAEPRHRAAPDKVVAKAGPQPKPLQTVGAATAETNIPQRAVAKPKPRLATSEPVRTKPPPLAKPVATPARMPRVAAIQQAPAKPAAATDLAYLDQFVMSFYGQSWRYGDARKRAALEQSRIGFVERRGTCLGDACKRAAYLKLQREISAIVESGQPTR